MATFSYQYWKGILSRMSQLLQRLIENHRSAWMECYSTAAVKCCIHRFNFFISFFFFGSLCYIFCVNILHPVCHHVMLCRCFWTVCLHNRFIAGEMDTLTPLGNSILCLKVHNFCHSRTRRERHGMAWHAVRSFVKKCVRYLEVRTVRSMWDTLWILNF